MLVFQQAGKRDRRAKGRGIIKIRAEISDVETRKTREQINESRS